MKKAVVWLALSAAVVGCFSKCCCAAEVAKAVSFDGRNEIRLHTYPLAYEVLRDGVTVVAKTEIGLKVDGTCLVGAAKVRKPTVTTARPTGEVKAPVYKKSVVKLDRVETFVDWGDWAVRLVARNDGVAYRFETLRPGKIGVECEKSGVTIPSGDVRCWVNQNTAFGCEETVPTAMAAKDIPTLKKMDVRGGDPMIYLPLVYAVNGKHVAVTESDVFDYPIWDLVRREKSDGPVFLEGVNAKWPKKTRRIGGWGEETVKEGGRWIYVDERQDWLVWTEGTRTFPWRTFVLADEPSKFAEADIVFALARPQVEGDFSWVRPGKVAWDWWNAFDNLGEEKGCTTKGYERFIDFAQKTGVEYVIFDEGWSESLNIWKFHPRVDVPHLIEYANARGVGIILWMAWAQVYGCEAKVAEHFAKLGAKGFKVDFMDRGDAEVERFYWKFAEECRKNKMLVDYHGMHRPTGMTRAYPNVLNYEGVHGLEQMKWHKNNYDFMANDVRQCFLRMTAGPMDYTPGAMDNYPIFQYKGNGQNPGSCGTRCRQMAMMAVYEAPLQMLCDAPTKYEKNRESFAFMAKTPVVWDATVALGGTPDTYFAVARQAKDGAWYAAALNDATAREITVDLAFLGDGQWTAELFCDAPDSDKAPTHFVHTKKTVRAGEKFTQKCAPGGGFVMRLLK